MSRMKYLGISLTEKVWHVYTENYKKLLEEIKGLNNGKTFHILMEEVILLRCQYSINWSTDSVIPTKIPAVSFFRNWQARIQMYIKNARDLE